MKTTLNPPPVAFPLEVKLSFRPFVAYLRAQRDEPRHGGAYGLYTYLIDQFEQVPSCLDCPEDVILQPAWVDFVNGSGPLPDEVPQLPVDEFSFEGFSFFSIEDSTGTETIQQLREVFVPLESDTEPILYRRFEAALRNLCGQPDLQISVIPSPKVNGRFVHQELLRYQLRQFDDRLEQLIKEQFTPLQPAVEWKFYEAAWNALRRGQTTSFNGETTEVSFPQVYPLYGAVDVRDSSVERHKARRQDLLDQLGAVTALLSQIPNDSDRLEPLNVQRQHWQTRLEIGLRLDDEVAVAQFLTGAVNPCLLNLRLQGEWQAPLQHYFDRTDPQTGQFGQALDAYERSMSLLNATVNDYIDQEEKQLQTIYPHYFDRYRTDGMEYTIYAGQSIAPDQPFGRDHRRRLSEWQLSSMIVMAQLTNKLLPHLPLPLQTTQLTLLHAHPVDISFRPNERRFDVEGSYSIRYEVLKKRIDKARINGTQERLTQPDTLALVYTHTTELADYLPLIAHLQQRGSLQPGIDYLDLEPLQGVVNLQALRVRINYTD